MSGDAGNVRVELENPTKAQEGTMKANTNEADLLIVERIEKVVTSNDFALECYMRVWRDHDSAMSLIPFMTNERDSANARNHQLVIT